MWCVAELKIALLLVKNVFFGVKKQISELGCWVAQKHTTLDYDKIIDICASKYQRRMLLINPLNKN